MISIAQLTKLLPLASNWANEHERLILEYGLPLNEDQQIDAYLAGVKEIDKVRLMEVTELPGPHFLELRQAAYQLQLLTPNTTGLVFGHGIYIRSDCWNERRILVHKLVHIMQFERIGGYPAFLTQYLQECIASGHANGELEQEAARLEMEICSQH